LVRHFPGLCKRAHAEQNSSGSFIQKIVQLLTQRLWIVYSESSDIPYHIRSRMSEFSEFMYMCCNQRRLFLQKAK
uniref:Myotubularin phosphatase domain-containing protein n=1 Tax=Haemonchus placei TaxID=6290 RepID=A0A0N4VVU3_HAEPC